METMTERPGKNPGVQLSLSKKSGMDFLTALSVGHFDAVKMPLRSKGLKTSLLTTAYPI
ncbi:MAG: hypothetical protein KHY12_04385 [Firmicutes bacterium]|nr:hypothetical protein [Bacillota bacterium]